MQKTQVWSLGQEDALEEEMATHSIFLAWKIPWTEESGGLQSMGLHSWTWLSTHSTVTITYSSSSAFYVFFFQFVFYIALSKMKKYYFAHFVYLIQLNKI